VPQPEQERPSERCGPPVCDLLGNRRGRKLDDLTDDQPPSSMTQLRSQVLGTVWGRLEFLSNWSGPKSPEWLANSPQSTPVLDRHCFTRTRSVAWVSVATWSRRQPRQSRWTPAATCADVTEGRGSAVRVRRARFRSAYNRIVSPVGASTTTPKSSSATCGCAEGTKARWTPVQYREPHLWTVETPVIRSDNGWCCRLWRALCTNAELRGATVRGQCVDRQARRHKIATTLFKN